MINSATAQQCRPCGPDSLPPVVKLLVPQGAAGADFRQACQLHDDCYGRCSGRAREDCDCEFLHNMLRECHCASWNPRRCQRRAQRMYQLVRNFGESAYGQ